MENERQGPVGAIIVIFILFLALFVVIKKYGKESQTVVLQQQNNIANSDLQTELTSGSESNLYNRYIEEILKNREEATPRSSSEISSDFKDELFASTIVPNFKVTIPDVGKNIPTSGFSNQVDNIFVEAGKRGAFGEVKILSSQITKDGVLLDLSDYDREIIMRSITDYRDIGEKIRNTPTPATYEEKTKKLISTMEQLAYILNKITLETDKKIYPLWIKKYTETQFDILNQRYVF